MHIIESEHNLMNDVDHLAFGKRISLGESFEQLTAFNELRDHIVVFRVFYQIDNSDDVGV